MTYTYARISTNRVIVEFFSRLVPLDKPLAPGEAIKRGKHFFLPVKETKPALAFGERYGTPSPDVGDTVAADATAIARVWPVDVSRVKAAARALVNDRRVEWRYPGRVDVALSTGKSFGVDARDERDLTSLHALTTMGLARAAAGDATKETFRDADNRNQTLSAAELVEQGAAAFAAIKAASLTRSWDLKSEIDAAGNDDAVRAILAREGLI